MAKYLTLALLLMSCGALFAATTPNVVVIFTDDQGYQDLGVFGSPNIKTPHIDQMAAEGMKLTEFYVAASVCSPSRAALMTGSYPARAGGLGVLFPRSTSGLHPDEVTIADLLKTKDYATALIGKWHLGHDEPFLPINQGFDYFWGLPYSNNMKVDPEMKLATDIVWREGQDEAQFRAEKVGEGKGAPLMRGAEVIEYPLDQTTFTTRAADEAVAFITANKDRPFFLYLPLTMPHFPLYVSDDFRGKSEAGLYGDSIEEVDWATGQVLDALRELGIANNTLVIFTSDNGPNVKKDWTANKVKGDMNRMTGGSALPLRGGKFGHYEGGMRVPAVAWWPGRIPAGSVCNELCTAMDVLPTVAAMSGATLPENTIDGHNILPLLEGQSGAVSPYETFFYVSRGVRKGDWKLLLPTKKSKRNGETEVMLFNLANDLSETTNVAAENPEVVKELTALIKAHVAEMDAEGRPRGSL